MRLRFRKHNKQRVEKICKLLDELGIKHSKITRQERIRTITDISYETNIQARDEIVKFLDFMKWKGNTPNAQVKVNGIKQYINSPLA